MEGFTDSRSIARVSLNATQTCFSRSKRPHKSFLVLPSPPSLELQRKIEVYAPTDVEIVLTGPTGVGKDQIAKLLHDRSKRPGRFIQANHLEIPEGMVESEFFGHVKGAFTGAYRDHQGFLQRADGGTLFINELDKAPRWLQAKLLGCIEEKVVRPLGASEGIEVDFRVIAATTIDLRTLVEKDQFRPDLYYRLSSLELFIPPLKERKEDIIPLAHYFIKYYSDLYRKPASLINLQAETALLAFHWPGNIRQLQKKMELAVIGAKDGAITESQVKELLAYETPTGTPLTDPVESFEAECVRQALTKADSIAEAAKELRVPVYRMKYLMNKHRLGLRECRRKR